MFLGEIWKWTEKVRVWSLKGGYSIAAAQPLRKLDPLDVWVWIAGLEEGSDHWILNIWRENKGIAIQINKQELDCVKIYIQIKGF